MNDQPQLSKDGSPSATDEQINTSVHLAAVVFALLGMVLLIVYAGVAHKPWHIVGFSIYGFSLVALFLASVLHHGIDGSERTERILRAFDYFAIFILIAGTYTPVCLTILRGPLGWSVFGVAWLVAVVGITLRAAVPHLPKWITNTLYVTMGWLSIVLVVPLYRAMGWPGLSLLVAGGVAYTVGAVIFAVEKPNPVPGKFGFHEIWHLLVVAGALCHFFFMFRFILPAA